MELTPDGRAFVICMNDYPASVFHGDAAGAEALRDKLKAKFAAEHPRDTPNVHWHIKDVPAWSAKRAK